MRSLNEVLSFLQRVRSLQFDASSEAATGWDGVGTGVVTVLQPAALAATAAALAENEQRLIAELS